MILFIDQRKVWCYTRVIEARALEPHMSTTRPSFLIMATFVAAAAALVAAAAAPILQTAAMVIA